MGHCNKAQEAIQGEQDDGDHQGHLRAAPGEDAQEDKDHPKDQRVPAGAQRLQELILKKQACQAQQQIQPADKEQHAVSRLVTDLRI